MANLNITNFTFVIKIIVRNSKKTQHYQYAWPILTAQDHSFHSVLWNKVEVKHAGKKFIFD